MIKKNKILTTFLFLCTLLFSTGGYSQNNLNLSEVDRITLELYNTQQWNELIDFGKKAINDDIEFYYLNYRMGIAYYSLKKYRKAIPYFEDVIKQTPNDAIAKEYLYYSYLLGGRISDATNTLYTLSKKHRDAVEFHKTENLFNGLGFEYKYFSFDDFAINKTVTSETTQKVRNSMNYFSADLLNFTENSSTIYMNISLIKGDNSIYNYYYSEDIINEKLSQLQIYLSWSKRISKGLDLNISATYMHETLDWHGKQWNNPSLETNFWSGSTNNFVGFVSLTKSIHNLDISLGSTFSKINNEKQMQPYTSFAWYPFGNKSFYSNTNISYQYNFNNNNNNLVLKQSFTSELNSNFSLSAFGLYGTVYNYIDDNGMSIYNNLDAIEYWYGFSAKYNFSNTTNIYLSYRNDRQTNVYTENSIEKNIGYNVNSLLVGLRFSF